MIKNTAEKSVKNEKLFSEITLKNGFLMSKKATIQPSFFTKTAPDLVRTKRLLTAKNSLKKVVKKQTNLPENQLDYTRKPANLRRKNINKNIK